MHGKKNVAQVAVDGNIWGFFSVALVNARRKMSIELLIAASFSFRLCVNMQIMAEDNCHKEKLISRPHGAEGEYWRWYREAAVSSVVE